MTLTRRVSLFFLVTLGLALLGNACLLYGLAQFFLYQRFEQQLQAALRTMVAAVEVEDDDVKWEPSDHTIALGSDTEVDDVRWAVFDEAGRLIDSSRNLSPATTDSRLIEEIQKPELPEAAEIREWQVLHRVLSAAHPKPVEERTPMDFASLRVVVARSTAEIRWSLWRLLFLVAGVSLIVWLIAATLGTAYCQRALQPLRDMVIRANSVKNADFRLRLPIGRQRDELSDLSTAFNSLLDRLQYAFEQQQRFTGDAAHQLRTPLTVLLGHIDVALRRQRSVEDYEKTLCLLKGQSIELRQIVEALLFLARMEGHAQLPEVQHCYAQLFLADCAARWAGHERAADLRVETAPDTMFSTSVPLLNQLLDNLVSNAFKYSSAGSPVTIGAEQERDAIVFYVRDRGIGIAREDQQAIFEPFFRSERARQSTAPGTGLGLAIAARIARALGGNLTCDSSEQGTVFRLAHPLHQVADTGD